MISAANSDNLKKRAAFLRRSPEKSGNIGLGDAFIEEPSRPVKTLTLKEALTYSYMYDIRFYQLTAFCILMGLALWWGNGIHCLLPHPNNTCLSTTPVDFAQAITGSCPIHPLGE